MKVFRNRFVVAAYLLLLAAALIAGCSTKEDPAEVLVTCGNHSCGQLAMVTIDTSSDGFQYLEPDFSPDGTRIAFSADWAVIPSVEEVGDAILTRQILIAPVPADIWADTMLYRNPVENITDLGAELVRLNAFVSIVFGVPNAVSDAVDINKASPIWYDDNTLVFMARFSRRDRMLIADVSNPASVDPAVLFYEPDDLETTGGTLYYHNDPALSPDGRWLVFKRFGCDGDPNVEGTDCEDMELWVLDMETAIADPTNVTAFPVTSGAAWMEDPTWSPDGRSICFASTTDLIDLNDWQELFRVDFDPLEAETGVVTVDHNLRRLTTTDVTEGDPLIGLQNYSPVYSSDGSSIYFVSSRRTPASTLRTRSIWQIPADGRLEPSLTFFSRYDDVDPTIYVPTGTLLLSSRMGFPTEVLDALEQETIDYYINEYNADPENIPLSDVEIERRAADEREDLEFFEDVMSHLYMFRGF